MLTPQPWVWAATIAGFAVLLGTDMLLARRPSTNPTRTALVRMTIYIALALLFTAGLLLFAPGPSSEQFFAGYVTEYSLSIDNLFVFLLIMRRFAVPAAAENTALSIGIAVSLVLRGVLILTGAALLERFEWLFFALGALLLYTAIQVARQGSAETEEGYVEPAVVRALRRVLPVSPDWNGPKLIARVGGRRVFTPLVVVMAAISVANVVFALDSIPAIFGLTSSTYIIVTANAFALLGLQQLYHLVGRLLERLVLLNYGLAVILAFIGVKLVLEALRAVSVYHLGSTAVPQIGTGTSLVVIVAVLAITAVSSLLVTRARRGRGATSPTPISGDDRSEAVRAPRNGAADH